MFHFADKTPKSVLFSVACNCRVVIGVDMLRLFAYDELLSTLLCCVRLRVSSRYWLCCVAFGCSVVDNCSFRTSISAFSRCTSASFSAFKRSISACISARSFANSSTSFGCCVQLTMSIKQNSKTELNSKPHRRRRYRKKTCKLKFCKHRFVNALNETLLLRSS